MMNKLPDDNRLEEMLKQRLIKMEPDNFAERIISASRNVIQRKNVSLSVWLRRIFSEFSLPTPSYALASILLVGFLLGLGLHDVSAGDNIDSDAIFNEESIL
jgi:hypothetical protein